MKKERSLKKSQLELQSFQRYLGLYMEPLTHNQTRFTFVNVDPTAPERPFTFIIDVSDDSYSAIKCEPMVSNLRELVEELNLNRDFYGFLKRIRRAFWESTCTRK